MKIVIVIVTGGGRGLGASTAVKCAERGARESYNLKGLYKAWQHPQPKLWQ